MDLRQISMYHTRGGEYKIQSARVQQQNRIIRGTGNVSHSETNAAVKIQTGDVNVNKISKRERGTRTVGTATYLCCYLL